MPSPFGRRDDLFKPTSLSSLMEKERATTLTTTTRATMESLLGTKEKSYKALITKTESNFLSQQQQQQQQHFSYFLSITIPSSKVRIKIPKLLAKAVNKKKQQHHPNGKKPKLFRRLFSMGFASKKMDSGFSASVNEKTEDSSLLSKTDYSSVLTSSISDGRSMNEEEFSSRFSVTNLYKTDTDYSESFRSISSSINSGIGIEPCILESSSSSEDLHAFNKISEIQEEENGKKSKSSIEKLLKKKISLKISGRSFACGSNSLPSSSPLKHKGWKKKVEMDGKEEEEEMELCKKKILMGGRCRPLST